jgi:hypothetical protein
MKFITTHYWNRKVTKLKVWCRKKLDPHETRIGKAERDAMIIFNALVRHPESELLIHPSGEKFYVKSEELGIFVTVSGNESEISIINHVYGYNVRIGSRVLKNVSKTFTTEVEKRRVQMEQEYMENIQHSLAHLAKSIKERI